MLLDDIIGKAINTEEPLPHRIILSDSERALFRAVLEDAINVASGQGKPDDVQAAREWLELREQHDPTKPDETWIFSFTMCCLVLGLDSDATRKAILTKINAGKGRKIHRSVI